MNIDEIYDFYIGRMAEVHLYQSDMKDLTINRLESLNQKEERIHRQKPDDDIFKYSVDWLTARNVYTGKIEKIERSKRTTEELKLSLLLHKNKQYQWLLVESYELFEDCLELLYAYTGRENQDYWPLRDFGSITLSELEGKGFEWFLEQAKRKKDIPSSLINFFRATYPEMRKIDIENGFGVNLHLALNLMESLRHVIVHLGGDVRSKDKFIERVLRKSGLYNSGNPSAENVELINYYFGHKKYSNTVCLFERPIESEIPLPMYKDELRDASSYLMGFIRVLVDCMKKDENL